MHEDVLCRQSVPSFCFCLHRGFFCLHCFCLNIVIMMGAMIMASIFAAVIISLIGIIRLPLLVFLPMILVVLGMNER